jgi:hypothetical protein
MSADNPIVKMAKQCMVPVERPAQYEEDKDLPYVTHEGTFTLMGFELTCYKLNTGQTIIEKESLETFLVNCMGFSLDDIKELREPIREEILEECEK